jgi:hypothetical protein
MIKRTLLAASAAMMVMATPAAAKPGKGKGNPHSAMKHGRHSQGALYGFDAGGCPPGLAKKNPQCMPPGQHKKMFNVGQRLPYGYHGYTPYEQIPYDLRRHYGLDDDYRYIYRDDYLYRVDPTTMVVTQILRAIL